MERGDREEVMEEQTIEADPHETTSIHAEMHGEANAAGKGEHFVYW